MSILPKPVTDEAQYMLGFEEGVSEGFAEGYAAHEALTLLTEKEQRDLRYVPPENRKGWLLRKRAQQLSAEAARSEGDA